MPTDTGPSFLRAAGFVGPSDITEKLTIVGCGAVGSHVALTAARMGFSEFELWDDDNVEPHNLPNQTYMPKHIGTAKVVALGEVLKEFNPAIRITQKNMRLTTETADDLSGMVLIATDSMSSRQEISKLIAMNFMVSSVVELRLGFDYGEVHIIDNLNPEEVTNWQATFKNDDEVEEGPCNLKICTTLVLITSAFAVHQMCEKFAAQRRVEEWKYQTRTVFALTPPNLVVHHL